MIGLAVGAPKWVRSGLHAARSRWTLWSAARRLDVARYWHARGELDEAAQHAHRALWLVSGPDAPPVTLHADVAVTVAEIDRDRANYAASDIRLASSVQSLDAAPPTANRDRLLARALIGLGDCHRRAGRYAQATTALHRARQIIETAKPPNPRLLPVVLTAIGITAKELGDYDEAAQCYAHVASIYRDHRATLADQATLSHNLAGLAYTREEYAAAEAHARHALALRRRAKAAAVDIAADLAVLGAALAAQRRHAEARDCLSRALAACRAAQPPRRYEIAIHLHNLATIDQASGYQDDAERGYREALAIKEQLLGSEHPEVGLVYNNLGTLLDEQQRHGEAVECYRRALIIAERTYPASHPTTTAIRHNFRRTVSDRRHPPGPLTTPVLP